MDMRLSRALGVLAGLDGMAHLSVRDRRQGRPGARPCQATGPRACDCYRGNGFDRCERPLRHRDRRWRHRRAGARLRARRRAWPARCASPLSIARRSAGAERPRDARAFALSASTKNMLALLGVWPAIAEHAQPVTTVDITDSSLDDAFRPILVSYDNRVDGEPATWIVENDRLRRCADRRRGGACRASRCSAAARRKLSRATSTAWMSRSPAAGRCAPRCWLPPTDAPRACARPPASRWCAGAIPRSASSPPCATPSPTRAAPCSISCPPARSPCCR